MKPVLILLFTMFLGNAASQSYPIKHYNTHDGLTSNIVYDAIQDDQGYMWFATNIGVSRFDGRNWKNYTMDQGLGDNEILKIKKDQKGRIWLFGFNGTVNIIHNGEVYNDQNLPILRGLYKGHFYRTFYADKNDEMWLSNKRSNPYKIIFPDKLIPETQTDSLLIFKTQNVLIKLSINQDYTLPGKLTNGTVKNAKSEFQFLSWWISGDSTLMAVTQEHILKIDNLGKHTFYPINLPKDFNIIDFYFTSENSIWISADKQGILHYKLQQGKYILKEKLLTDNYITSTYIDREGNLWFSSYGSGIFMMPYNYASISYYTQDNGLKENGAFAVCVDRKNKIWVGHKYEFIDVIDNNQISKIQLTNSNTTVGRVSNIQEHPMGYMMVSYDEGFIVADINRPDLVPMRRVTLEMPNGIYHTEQPIKDFYIDKFGDTYIASQENIHLLKAEDLKKKRLVSKKLNLTQQRIFSVSIDDDGHIWYGDADGLAKYDKKATWRFESVSPLLKNRIEDIAWIKKQMFLSIMGHGILVLENHKVKAHITTLDGLLSNHCSKLLSHNNEMYVCSNQGLNKIRLNDKGNYVVSQISTYSLTGANQVNDVFVSDQHIYIASLNGISILSDEAANSELPTVPDVYFNEVIYKNTDCTKQTNIEVDYQDRHLTFKFIAPTFYHPEGVRYQYKLNQNPWIELNNPFLELNALGPGNYLLEVRARHSNSDWSIPIAYPFHVSRPFYLSWWFYTLLGTIIIIWVYISYRSKIKKLKAEQRLKIEYEQEINQLQLKALQAMINPHFLFNSLSAIQQQINAGENQQANNYLTRFSKLLRKNLETINESFVTIDEEITRLELYLSTEKMRLGDKLNYTIYCDKDLDSHNVLVPTMLLQPLVENAIWHGIVPSEHRGEIEVIFRLTNGHLEMQIKDNGIGYELSLATKKPQSLKGKAMGMKITMDRLKYLEKKYKKPIELTTTDLKYEGSQGTKVVISMALISAF